MDFIGFTVREWITILHGMIMGGILLLVFPGVLVGLWSLRPEWSTTEGLKKHLRFLTTGSWIASVFSWLTVIIGCYFSYPWYRLKPPAGVDLMSVPDLLKYPAAHTQTSPNGRRAPWNGKSTPAGWLRF